MNDERTGPGGFTLIEVAVVAGLIAVVALLVFPRFTGLVGNRTAVSFSRRLAGTLDYARARAVLEGRPYYFYLDRGSRQYWVTRLGADGREEPAPGRLGRRRVFPDEVRLGGRVSSPIRFYPGGNSDEALIELRLTDDFSRRYRIEVKEYAGRTRLEIKG